MLSGEIYRLIDDEDFHLNAGDVIVQRGTNHAWSNRGTEPCVIVFVLVDGVTTRDAPEDQKTGIPAR